MFPVIRTTLPLLASTFIVLMAQGTAGMLLPLRATEAGWSASAIGWMGSAYAIGFTIACLVLPRIVMRVGHVRAYAAVVTMLSASMLLHALVFHPIVWALIRCAGGFALAGTYMLVESWLSEKSDNANRGAIFSIYMLVNFAGLIAGQYTMSAGPQAGISMFLISALIFSAAVFPVTLSTAQSPRPLTSSRFDLKGLYRNSPAALVGSFLAGIVSGLWNFLAPVYGSGIGLSTVAIATMMASAMVGGMVFQFPMGRLSDRIDRRHVMTVAGAGGVAISLVLVLLPPGMPWLVFGAMFLFGSVLFPIYSLNVAHANDFAEPEDFVKISSGLLIVYGFGSMAGPVVGGRAMDMAGPSGFFATMAVIYAAYGLYAFWRTLKREAPKPVDRPDYRPLGVNKTPTPETYTLDARSDPEGDAQSPGSSRDRNTFWGYDFSN